MNNSILANLFYILLVFQFVSAVGTFVLLFFVNAPYGRHINKKFGPTIHPKLGWVIMEFPAFFVILLFYIIGMVQNEGVYSDGRSTFVVTLFLVFWQMHYIQRTFIFPFIMAGKGKAMAIVIPLFGMIFNTMNGYLSGYFFFSGKSEFFEGTPFQVNIAKLYSEEWLSDPRFITGAILFVIGMAINIHSDHILRTLRKPGETGYKIPNKGFFKYVTNANYFGEFTEWGAFAIMTWSLPGLAFAVFTFANLAPRAYSNRKWYRQYFGDEYPKKRKAIIPFIF